MGEHRIKLARGRPSIPLKDHPFKLPLVCVDLLFAAGMSRQQATLLITAIFFAEGVEPVAPADLAAKMRRAFEQNGGLPLGYTIPASGNPETRKVKECMQPVDTLNKLDKRYAWGADRQYRDALAKLVLLAVFVEGDKEERRKMVETLKRQLDDPDPQIQGLVELLEHSS
jgi:hypothetical protein